jgi:dephospho-CoA kinase
VNIIGIAGLPRSGKDSLAELFMNNGYLGVSLGDIVRDESRSRHAAKADPISVANMTETSNWLRQTRGADFALKEALNRFEKAAASGYRLKGLVVFSVRVPVEVDFILSHGGELIWVEASDEVRHERGIEHLREGEAPISLEEFKRQEDLQWQPQPSLPSEVQMNVSYVKDKATQKLVNNGDDLEEFIKAGERLINELEAGTYGYGSYTN